METLKLHLGNYGASVTGQSVGKERKGPEEEVSKIGTTDKKEKEKIQTYMKTRLRLFLSLLTCSHQLVGKAFTSLLILLCQR